MNKKAIIFHWSIIFGFLIALGVFLYYSQVADLNLESKGTWQIDFLNKYYFPAQEDLLKLDLLVKHAAGDVLHRLAGNGGFVSKIPCGQIKTPTKIYVIRNKKIDFATCAPQISKEFVNTFAQTLNQKYPARKYNSIQLKKNTTLGKVNQKPITSNKKDKYYAYYSYNTGFEINLGFDLQEEYFSLRKTANNLVTACHKKSSLESCIKKHLKETKLLNWKFSDCTSKFYSAGRKVAFCVESKNQAYKNKILTPLKHYFALDFSNPS